MTIPVQLVFQQKENIFLFPCTWTGKSFKIKVISHGALVSKVSLDDICTKLRHGNWLHGTI